MEQGALKVSELNGYIKEVINAGFPHPVWVCGEIQGYDRNKNRNHIFFELVEKDPLSSDIVAKAGLVIFSGRKAQIQNILKESENNFTLKDDIEVKFACTIDFYPPHGAVRLIVESIDPTYTLGKLAQEKQKLIAKLREKGRIDKKKQVELNPVSLNIGLITADDSAAYNDFLSELKKSGYGFKIFRGKARMEGKRTEKEIVDAIDDLHTIDGLDAIVITRGGGSLADLSYFDSEKIAERIAASTLPVLSGIGHEINISITDLAAHTYAKTPTAIAQFLVGRVEEFLLKIDEGLQKLVERSEELISQNKRDLKDNALRLQTGLTDFLADHYQKIVQIQENIKHKAVMILQNQKQTLNAQKDIFLKTFKQRFITEQNRLKSYTKIIDLCHPAKTMSRGFSITRNKDGKVIRSVKDIHSIKEISTELADGTFESIVK